MRICTNLFLSFFSEMAIGLNIKHLRYLLGLTTRQLAADIGTTNSSISRYETGESEPSFDMVQKISGNFKIPVEVFARENLQEKWATRAEYEAWIGNHDKAQILRSSFEPSVEMMATITRGFQLSKAGLIALKKHYAQYLSGLSGRAESEILKEIEEIEMGVVSELFPDPTTNLLEQLKKSGTVQ